jgi:hypothetical protein
LQANVAIATNALTLADIAIETYGKIETRIKNVDVGVEDTLLTTNEEDWDRIFAMNVKGSKTGVFLWRHLSPCLVTSCPAFL